MKQIAILGSTGSIGINSLSIIKNYPTQFRVYALVCNKNYRLLSQQVVEFRPKFVYIQNYKALIKLKKLLDTTKQNTTFLSETDDINLILSKKKLDIVIAGIVGSAGLRWVISSIEYNKKILLANKETLVMAGPLINKFLKKSKALLLPVDSEHNSIFQLTNTLNSQQIKNINDILLTGSGGPFRKKSLSSIKLATPKQAINHPIWKMGAKISVDSATLMNKSLELIEAHNIFNFSFDKYKVLIQPEGVIHGVVNMKDGSSFAHMYNADMKIPISNVLFYPNCNLYRSANINFSKLKQINFEEPRHEIFPSIKLAHEVLKEGMSAQIALNASNEIAVDSFLNKKIKFLDIFKFIQFVLDLDSPIKPDSIEEIIELDSFYRKKTIDLINHK